MAMTERERRRRKFEAILASGNLTTAEVAAMLHSSVPRVTTWRRLEGAAGAHPVPMWAIELLEFKISVMVPPGKAREDK